MNETPPDESDAAIESINSQNPMVNLSTEKERLLIIKLQLDNEEQRARIEQLKLQWWQKPFGILAMILPLVPILATGVAAIASKWSEQQRAQADVAKKGAEVEKQGYELENKRLGQEKAKTLFENTLLRFDQDKLKNEQRLLETRVQTLAATERKFVNAFFQRYISVSEIGAKLVTANDLTDAEEKFAKLDAFDILAIDTNLTEPIQQIKAAIKQWKDSGLRPKEQLESAALALSGACKSSFQKHKNDQFQKPLIEITMSVYDCTLGEHLATFDGK
jgi:hypothetical protein